MSETGLCWLSYEEQMTLRRLLKAFDDAASRIMEMERDNKALRAEIEVLQRMRHSNLEHVKC